MEMQVMVPQNYHHHHIFVYMQSKNNNSLFEHLYTHAHIHSDSHRNHHHTVQGKEAQNKKQASLVIFSGKKRTGARKYDMSYSYFSYAIPDFHLLNSHHAMIIKLEKVRQQNKQTSKMISNMSISENISRLRFRSTF